MSLGSLRLGPEGAGGLGHAVLGLDSGPEPSFPHVTLAVSIESLLFTWALGARGIAKVSALGPSGA